MQTKEKGVVQNAKSSLSENQIQRKKTKKDIKNILKTKKKLLAISVSTIVLLLIVIIVAVSITKSNHTGVSTISKSSLQKVLEINELSTVDYTYNATTEKYDNNKNVVYYVAYEGTVTAGIDFSKIDIKINEKNKKVTFTIPPVKIHDVKVNMGTMEFIFVQRKGEKEDVSQEAYKLCNKDLKERIQKESLILDSARQNTISSMEALFKPWIENLDNSYTVEIK